MAVQVHEADHGRVVELNSLPRGDLLKRVVDVRQMIDGDVMDKGVRDFILAHAAMQPAEEEYELDADSEDGGQYAVPVGRHGGPWEVHEAKEINEVKEVKDKTDP
jgi:hypothetical protein